MRHRPSYGRLLAAVLALTAALTATSAVTGPGAAQAADLVQCRTTVPVFTVVPDGRLFLWGHDEPENGVAAWQNGQEVGQGWGPNTWAGHDGRVYTISDTGELHRRRWVNNAWEGGGPGAYTVIGTGFGTYRDPAYRTKFTVDALGHFYRIDPEGSLRWRSYNETTGTWSSEAVLDAGWGGYTMIVAAGNGVIYARSSTGSLYRYKYHVGSQRLSGSEYVSGDWGGFSKVFSPGGDVLYAVRPTGKLLWYRYNPSSGQWVTGSGREIASGGWAGDPATVATTDACRLASEPEPQRPAVPADRSAPAALAKTSDGYLQYGYVDSEGRLVRGEIRDLYNVNPNGFAAFPGYAGFTGKPTFGENQNGQLRVYAHSTDSDVRGALRTSPAVWGPITNFTGRMRTNPQIVRTSDNLVTFVALDENGAIWTKPQRVLNGTIHAWRKHTYSDSLPVAPAGPLTATAHGTRIELTALGVDGMSYTYSIAAAGSASTSVPPPPWTPLNGPAGGPVATVEMPNGDRTWFARASDGLVWTKRTGAAWTVLPAATVPGVTAAGAPSAVLAPDGTLQVAVRGTDGFVYRTGQANPGSGTWLPWTEITGYAHETAVDPTVSLAADTWVIAYRTPAGDPKLRRFQPSTTAARTAGAAGDFVEVPLTLTE